MASTATRYSLSSRITLPHTGTGNAAISMPTIHLGVYMTSGSSCRSAVVSALRAGYRAIDSAEWYGNEAEVGAGIREFLASRENVGTTDSGSSGSGESGQQKGLGAEMGSGRGLGLKREDIWFTTKLKTNAGYAAARKSIRRSVERSGLGWVDLYLVHSPYGGRRMREKSWKAVMEAVEEGLVRVGGVSNFGVGHLQELLDSKPRILPAVNQIEVHPFNTNTAITSFCAAHDIIIEAYAPLVRALRMKHPVISSLSKKYECTPAQLLVRWSLQHGYVPLPKSVTESRIRENAEVEGFEIDEGDMKRLDGCDEHLVTDWDPTDAD